MNRLKEFRLKEGLTQKELAEKSKISVRSIQAYESEERKIEKMNLKSALSISRVLKIRIEELIKKG